MHRYADQRPMIIGDVVEIPGCGRGKIVAIVDQKKFSEEYPAEEWLYLESGLLLEMDDMGLVHYPSSLDEKWYLMSRQLD